MDELQTISKIHNQDGNAAILQNCEVIDITTAYGDTSNFKLSKPALLSVYYGDDVADDADISIQTVGNDGPVIIKAWEAKSKCFMVTQIYSTGTTVDSQYLKLYR
jgi:hypothetical protein